MQRIFINHLQKKRNRVKTIKASLEIEGNTLSEDQITAIIKNKRVIKPKKDILDVVNAIAVYEKLSAFKPNLLNSFLKAHKPLLTGLIDAPGKFRTMQVGIFNGSKVAHLAPPAANLSYLMKDLFEYLKSSDDHVLIKSCVAHYEIEFIHLFMDVNGRMGRFWQTAILMNAFPLFEFLPFETFIKERQNEYYSVLENSDKEGKSTKFIEFVVAAINESLETLSNIQNRILTTENGIDYFILSYKDLFFSRQASG